MGGFGVKLTKVERQGYSLGVVDGPVRVIFGNRANTIDTLRIISHSPGVLEAE